MKIRHVALGLTLLGSSPHARADKFSWEGQVEIDAGNLASDDPKKRLEAVAQLAMDDIHLSQPYLLKALADEDPGVRQQAAKALGAGGAVAAVPAMIEWLSDAEVKTRTIAAEVLGDIGGPDAMQALTRSLGDADATVRQRAVKSLGKIGLRGSASVVIALIPRLEDDKADVRRETVEQLEQLGDHRAVISLVARFGDTSLDVRKAAVRAVGKLGDRSAVPALVRLMNDSSEDVRTAAVGSLGLLGAVDAIDALTEQLATGSDLFRAKVAYALGQIAATSGTGKTGEDAMRTLVENLAIATTRAAAQDALSVAGKAAVPALVAHLTGRLKGDPTTAVKLLTVAADARATAALSAELERGRVATPLVLKALGATGDPAALVPVLGALSNKDAAIRLAAMEALRPLIGSDARAGDVLIEHLADEDLEIRVLAAEYLGALRAAAAAPKLIALTGSGNPPRLRLAAIDALGEIGRPDAAKPLVDVLRDGPPELHRAAATALSYLAAPSAIPALIVQAQTDRGSTRHEIVRALGASLRGHRDPVARKVLRDLAQDSNVKVAIAAICGLAAAADPEDAAMLRMMVAEAASDRRRAAAWALGEIHDLGAFATLSDALAVPDDRLVGDATWALGELAVAAPSDRHVAPLVERWLHLAHHGGWAAAIDASGALARMLWTVPREARTALLSDANRTALVALTFHKSRLVRINAVLALSSLTGDAGAMKALAQLAHDDPSPHVRIAAEAAVARTTAKVAPTLPARGEWRMFYVVDHSADDAPVRQAPYFVQGADGVVWATFTDARGEITTEHAPPGDAIVWPASSEAEY